MITNNLRHSPYLGNAINNQKLLVDLAQASLKDVEFDGFVGMGLSGSMVAPLLAFVLGKRFAIVRKDKSSAHSHHATTHGIESGLKAGDRWLFCDDFISSGRTRKIVVDTIENHVGEAWYVGDYLYGAGGYDTSFLAGRDTRGRG